MARALDVWCFGEMAGLLSEQNSGELSFTYDPTWIEHGRTPLSQSLPLDGSFPSAGVAAFFGGLLPEGDLRGLLARELGISESNDFSLLERIGGDCAGAVSVFETGTGPTDRPAGIDWLNEDEIERRIVEMPRRPMVASDEGEYRLSLAGAQDKMPVVVEGERIGLPKGSRPSTHILKAPISWLPSTVANEAFCLAVGRELGIDCVEAEPHRFGAAEFLLVRRYDRVVSAEGRVERLHQEDFCQALGIPSSNKYESEGGPSLVDCVNLVRAVSDVPAEDILGFVDTWALSFLAGNHDAHGKNYSLLYVGRATRLAPAYDILSSTVYRSIERVDSKMAMKLGTERRPDYMAARHLDAFLEGAGLGKAATRRRLATLARGAPAAVASVSGRFAETPWWDQWMDRIVEVFEARSRLLVRLTSA